MHMHLAHHSVMGGVVLSLRYRNSWQTTVFSAAAADLKFIIYINVFTCDKKAKKSAIPLALCAGCKMHDKGENTGARSDNFKHMLVVVFVSGLFVNKPPAVSTAVLISFFSIALLTFHSKTCC